jgi:hypothetical protein
MCSAGAASTVSGTGPWTWSCIGTGGGTTAQCSAPLAQNPPVNGQCGASKRRSDEQRADCWLFRAGNRDRRIDNPIRQELFLEPWNDV